ncbi:MAG: hypothetical protein SNJ56_04335, partial [Termitinemataceae bacterium]
ATQKVLTSLSTYLIMIAVASIGLSTNLRKLGHWGVKPLLTGIAASLAIGILSFTFLRVFQS